MTFARTTAALLFTGALLSPLRFLLRSIVVGRPGDMTSSHRLSTAFDYLLLLLGLYVLLVVLPWAGRQILVFTDRWANLGLEDLDHGVRGFWASLWALILGVGLILAVAVMARPRTFALPEAMVISAAVILGVLGSPPAVNPIGEYDPLPQPVVEPLPVEPSPQPQPAPPPTDDVIPLTLRWYFHREPFNATAPPEHYEVRLQASRSRYNEFLRRDHNVCSHRDYARFVRDGLTPEVDETARQIRQASTRDRLGALGEINNVLAFAQSFRYVLDEVDKGVKEYPKYPLETLVEDKGDCEDHAIAAAACLLKLGHEVRLVYVSYGSGADHMALAVAGPDDLPGGYFLRDSSSGTTFYYCEVSTDASSQNPNAVVFRMGEVPEKEKSASMELVRILDRGGAVQELGDA
jgi:predicted transglutaminase-like cysteine proteinase